MRNSSANKGFCKETRFETSTIICRAITRNERLSRTKLAVGMSNNEITIKPNLSKRNNESNRRRVKRNIERKVQETEQKK